MDFFPPIAISKIRSKISGNFGKSLLGDFHVIGLGFIGGTSRTTLTRDPGHGARMIPTCAFGLWPWECQPLTCVPHSHARAGPHHSPTPYLQYGPGAVPPEPLPYPAWGDKRIEDRGDGSEEL